MKQRWATPVLLYLALGMAINSVVAWGCSVWSPVVLFEPLFMPLNAPITSDLTAFVTSIDVHSDRDGAHGVLLMHGGAFGPGVQVSVLAGITMTPGDYPGGPDRALIVHRAGWPVKSFVCLTRLGYGNSRIVSPSVWQGGAASPEWIYPKAIEPLEGLTYDRPVPLRPLAIGSLINTIVFAGLSVLAWRGYRALLEANRRRKGLCAYCAYDVTLLPKCPECGRDVKPTASAA